VLNRNLICTDTTEFVEANTVTFLNPYSFLKISNTDIDLNRFDKVCIDGIALKIFLDLVFRDTKIERLSFDFTSVANLVFEKAATEKQTGFILGSDQSSNSQFLSKVSDMFPGIDLSGRSGYFDGDDDLTSCIQSLANSDHDFIVIGMGAVKQEEIAIALMDSGYQGKIYTCGGFIHQTALGGGEYYPAWIDKLNLRFAYRMFKEPSTIQRYLIDYPKAFFVLSRNIKNFKY
jgi:N-acetylglucosaminyldiphosphoundecaprenol N-acetyl-beta-D-mannosaminyltransferase